MEYNQLINELLDELDKNYDIKEIKELKKILLNDSDFLSDLNNFKMTNTVLDKKKLYENDNYLKYLKSEMNINYLIWDIKEKFNIFKRNGCFK